MGEFTTYFQLGLYHILDLSGYDHMLFLVALTATYSFHQWREMLVLVTAFTLGHCLTLILAGKGWISLDRDLVEILIALSITATAAINLIWRSSLSVNRLRYSVALFFGLIHGMGFSGFLKALLGGDAVLWRPLLFFNIGVEMGQVAIVGLLFLLNIFVVQWLSVRQEKWSTFLSLLALIWSTYMIIERI